MPDIPAFPAFADGAVVDADQVSERLYKPKLAPDSLGVVNGQITNANRLAGWPIDRELARTGFMSQGRTVGATANQDFFDDLFKDGHTSGFNPLNTSDVVIPGCAVDFRILPKDTVALEGDVVAVVFSWHISLISEPQFNKFDDGGSYPVEAGGLPPGNGTDGNWTGTSIPRKINPTQNIELTFYINDMPIPQLKRQIIQGRQTVSWGEMFPTVQFNDVVLPDTRQWSGSFIFDQTTATKLGWSAAQATDANINPMLPGWHSASIRLTYTTTGTNPGPNLGTRHVRVKTRRMSYTVIR